MERNYVGQGQYNGGAQNHMISSGRRAGSLRSGSGEDTPPHAYSPSYGADNGQGHMPRFGRRASPGSTPSGDGMEMDPPRYNPSAASGAAPIRPSGAIPRGGAAGAPANGGSAGSAGAVGGMNSKLSGLQRLKEASTARLVSRIPSSNGRTSGETGSYVPSAMTNQPPARPVPGRGAAPAAAPSYGSASGRSASTGAAMAAGARPPSGRSNGPSAGAASSGYGGGSSSRQPPASSSAAAKGGSSGYGRSSGGGADYGAPAPVAASVAARPAAAAAALAARRQPPAPPPPPAQPHPVARAPPPPPAAVHHQHGGGGSGGFAGGGGGGFGGGGAFGPGSIPPGAEEGAYAGPMVECPTCGRNFNQLAYSKHAKVCEKVFATKRKPVNMAAKRLEGSEACKFFDLRKGVPKSEAKPAAAGRGGAGRGAGLDDRPLPPSKVPKWKAQSDQLRAAMSANRQIEDAKARGIDIRNVKLAPAPAAPDDRVPCPYCGRKFAELTAERHIPKCKDTMAKPNRLAAGSGRGAHTRR